MDQTPYQPYVPATPDADHLRLLSIFHFVFAGLALLGLGFLLLHYALFSLIMNNPKMWEAQKGGGPDMRAFFAVFKWFYLVFGAFMAGGGVCNLLSGLWLRARRNRTFSLVVAGVNCLQIPFGTALGVMTIIVLVRPSVRELYRARQG